MMVVVAVMAEALHLYSRYGESPFGVKYFLLRGIIFLARQNWRTVSDAQARSLPRPVVAYLRARDERVFYGSVPRLGSVELTWLSAATKGTEAQVTGQLNVEDGGT